MSRDSDDFYLRYYVGSRQQYGHEFMEFEITMSGSGGGGKLKYANDSGYKAGKGKDMIRKEVCLSSLVIKEIKRILTESEITAEDDGQWPQPNQEGTQELEVKLGREHISFTVGSCFAVYINHSEVLFSQIF